MDFFYIISMLLNHYQSSISLFYPSAPDGFSILAFKLLVKELTYFYDQIGKHITWQIDKYW